MMTCHSLQVLKVVHSIQAYRRGRRTLAARAVRPVTSVWRWSDSANAVQAHGSVSSSRYPLCSRFAGSAEKPRQPGGQSRIGRSNVPRRLQEVLRFRNVQTVSPSLLAQLLAKSVYCFCINTTLAGKGSLCKVGIGSVLVPIVALPRLRSVAFVASLSSGLALLLIRIGRCFLFSLGSVELHDGIHDAALSVHERC